MLKKSALTLIFILITLYAFAQENRVEGKIIKDFGPTFAIDDSDIKTNTSAELKVIFDVSQSSEDKSKRNKYIETAARFLNMHANEGMKAEQLKVAMTIHGGAWHDVLDNETYKEKFGVDNPNLPLINALNEAGVDVIICGQTASYRGMTKETINPNVKMALSAMTALLQYQANDYKFIKF